MIKKSKNTIGFLLFCIHILLFYNSLAIQTKYRTQNKNDIGQNILEVETPKTLYLHTNGSIFYPGDTIWFKAYFLTSRVPFSSNQSGQLQIKVYNDQGIQKQVARFIIQKETTNGHVVVSDSLPGGKYLISGEYQLLESKSPQISVKKEIEIKILKEKEVLIKFSLADSVYAMGNIVQGEVEAIGAKNTRLGEIKINLRLMQNDNILARKVINTGKEGIGVFNIQIPEKLDSQAVFLQAEVQHRNLAGALTVSLPIRTLPPKIRFFPEGGQLIEGILSTLAFEATDLAGNPFIFDGLVEDYNGEKIATISTSFLGMGKIDILPQGKEKLFLKILTPKGYNKLYEFPQPLSKGYSLQILKNSDKNLSLKVESNIGSPTDSILLNLNLRDKVWFAKKTILQELNPLSIPLEELPMGVATITLYDKNIIPLAERLVFINENKKPIFKSDSLKNMYARKEKVNLNLEIKNNLNNGIQGNFSMGVSPVYSGKNPIWENNIICSLLLEDELKGEIPAKGYYFMGTPKSKEAIDLLMLTHGWRKYTLKKDTISETIKPIIPPIISGTVCKKNGKPIKSGDVTLMNVNTFYAISTSVNKEGWFGFKANELLDVLDESNLVMTASTAGGNKNIFIKLDNDLSQKELALFKKKIKTKKDRIFFEMNDISLNKPLPEDSADFLTNKYYSDITQRNFWIEDVDVRVKRPVVIPLEVFEKEHMVHELKDEEIRINFGQNEQSGILQLLHQVAGYFIVEEGGKILFRGYNSLYPENMQGAIFVINGSYVGSSYHDIDYLNAEDIQTIQVTKSSAAGLKFSSFGTGGLIEITTKGGKLMDAPSQPAKTDPNILSVPGYSLVKEFYSPVYKNPEAKKKQIDLRTTLFWDPHIEFNQSGKSMITFYSSDIPGEYELRIEGIDETGNPAYFTQRFNVNY